MVRPGTLARRRTTSRGFRGPLAPTTLMFLLVLPLVSYPAPSSGEAPLAVLYISVDTTWTKAGSPYTPADDVVVLDGARLTLEAGVEAVFTEGASLTVRGSISSEGSEAEPVILGSPGTWGGIALDDSRDPGNALLWTDIADASVGVGLHRSWLNASNCTIVRGGTGTVLNSSWASFSGVNLTGMETGASVENGSTLLLADSGLRVSGSGVELSGGGLNSKRTEFCNGARGIQALAGTTAGADGCTFANHSITGLEGLGAWLTVENCTFEDEDHCMMTTDSDTSVNGSLMNRTKNDSIRTIRGNITVTWCGFYGGQKALECFDTPAVLANCTMTGLTLKAFDGYKSPLTARDNVVGDCYAGFTVDFQDPGLIADNSFRGIDDKALSILYHNGSRIIGNEFVDVEEGIYTTYADGLEVANNTFHNTSDKAVGMIQGYGNITGNRAENCSIGFAAASADVNISSNVLENCTTGIDIQDIPGGSSSVAVLGNEVLNCYNGINTLRGAVDIVGNNITWPWLDEASRGIDADGTTLAVRSNGISGFNEGMRLVDAPLAQMRDNNISLCWHGLILNGSTVLSSGNHFLSNYCHWSGASSTFYSTKDGLENGPGDYPPNTTSSLTDTTFTSSGLQMKDNKGIHLIGCDVVIQDSHCEGDQYDGAFWFTDGCSAALSGCEFNSEAYGVGLSAIYALDSTVSAVNCLLESVLEGFVVDNTSLTSNDCTFEDTWSGITARNCPRADIHDSEFQGEFNHGIRFTDTAGLVDTCSFATTSPGYVHASGVRVETAYSSGEDATVIRDSHFSGFPQRGIHILEGRASVEGNDLADCYIGMEIEEGDIVSFEANTMTNCTKGAWFAETVGETSIWNSTFAGNILDIELARQATVRLINTPVDDDRVEVAGHQNNVLTKSWLVRLRVLDNVGHPLEDALVTVEDVDGFHVFQGLTDPYGLTEPFVADQEVSLGLSVSSLNPHTVTFSRSGTGVDVAQVVFDRNATYNLTLAPLDLELVSLDVDPVHPYPGQDVRVNATVRFHGQEAVPFFNAYLLMDGGDVEDAASVPGPEPGGTALIQLNVSSISVGPHNISVVIDLLNLVLETDDDNNMLTVSLNVEPLPIPMLNVNATSFGTYPGDPVRFDGYLSWGAVPIVAYRFDFGDGTEASWSASALAVHNYSLEGLYSARLALKDLYGRKGDWSSPQLVRVSARPAANRPPVCSFNVTPANGTVLTRYEFTAWALDADGGAISGYHWDFGDGALESAYGARISHVFSDDRLYFVSLEVEDDQGAVSLEAVERVQVGNIPPSASFTVSSKTPGAGEDVRFSARTGNETDPDDPPAVLDFLWDFGDGTQGRGANATHAFGGPGRFEVTLTVVDDDGARSNMTVTVSVTGGTGGGPGGASGGASAGTRGALAAAGVLVIVFALLSLFMALRRARAGAEGPGPGTPRVREPKVMRLQRTPRGGKSGGGDGWGPPAEGPGGPGTAPGVFAKVKDDKF